MVAKHSFSSAAPELVMSIGEKRLRLQRFDLSHTLDVVSESIIPVFGVFGRACCLDCQDEHPDRSQLVACEQSRIVPPEIARQERRLVVVVDIHAVYSMT